MSRRRQEAPILCIVIELKHRKTISKLKIDLTKNPDHAVDDDKVIHKSQMSKVRINLRLILKICHCCRILVHSVD